MSAIDPIIGPERARELFRAELAEVRTDAELQALRTRWVGRHNSWTTAFMEALKTATPEQKKTLGKGANELKKEVEAALTERETALAATRRPANAVDVTLPGRVPQLGHRHPLSLIRDEVIEIFTRLGYQVLEGPEIEDDYHNFEALNMPPEHPARDMQDTLYLQEPINSGAPKEGGASTADKRSGSTPRPLTLLRTHTSAMQIRHMEKHAPPVRLVAIGPVYRKDNLDLTHTPMFHQVEGLVVGNGISLADLKGTVSAMARELFGVGRRCASAPASSRTPSQAPKSIFAASSATAPAARCASAQAGSRSSAAAWCTRRCSRPSATTLTRSPASRSAWASSALPSSSGALKTSACSTKTICGSWSSSAYEGPAVVDPGVR